MIFKNKQIVLLFFFSISNCCIACSTEDPTTGELEDLTILAVADDQTTEIENSDDYLSEIKLADPYILRDGDYYYAYGTLEAQKGFHSYKSHDLKIWEHLGFVLEKKNTTASGDFWAPEVYKINETYFMFYAADRNLYVAKSDSPEGPFVQLGTMTLYRNGIDPHLYIEGAKKYLFFVNTSGKNSVWMGELNDDLLSLKEETIHECLFPQGWEKNVNEGPFMYKNGNTYYLTYTGDGFTSKNYGVAVATSSDVMGAWEKASYNPVLQKREPWVGTGHHSLFVDKDGVNRIAFHAHNDNNSVNPRRMYIGRFHIDGKGIFTVENTFIVPKLKEYLASVRSSHSSISVDKSAYSVSGVPQNKTQKGVSIKNKKKYINH